MHITNDIWKFDLGATVLDKGVSFKVWAPGREVVSVKPVSGGGAGKILDLGRDSQGYFTGITEGIKAGDRYVYVLDQKSDYPDPASRFQPDGVHNPSEI